MSTISINNAVLNEQPTSLDESWTKIGDTQTSISGNKQRVQFPSRKRVVMGWTWATPATVQYFKALEDAQTAVSYADDNSGFYGGSMAFSGVITVDTGEYQRGGTQLTQLTVTIEEGETYSA